MAVKIPRNVKIGPYDYSVRLEPALQRSSQMGECDAASLAILLDPEQAAMQMKETLIHESLHAMFYASGLANHMTETNHENAVGTLAPWVLMWLRDNKEVLKWLTTQ